MNNANTKRPEASEYNAYEAIRAAQIEAEKAREC